MNLPDEIIDKVSTFLTSPELQRTSLTCRSLYRKHSWQFRNINGPPYLVDFFHQYRWIPLEVICLFGISRIIREDMHVHTRITYESSRLILGSSDVSKLIIFKSNDGTQIIGTSADVYILKDGQCAVFHAGDKVQLLLWKMLHFMVMKNDEFHGESFRTNTAIIVMICAGLLVFSHWVSILLA